MAELEEFELLFSRPTSSADQIRDHHIHIRSPSVLAPTRLLDHVSQEGCRPLAGGGAHHRAFPKALPVHAHGSDATGQVRGPAQADLRHLAPVRGSCGGFPRPRPARAPPPLRFRRKIYPRGEDHAQEKDHAQTSKLTRCQSNGESDLDQHRVEKLQQHPGDEEKAWALRRSSSAWEHPRSRGWESMGDGEKPGPRRSGGVTRSRGWEPAPGSAWAEERAAEEDDDEDLELGVAMSFPLFSPGRNIFPATYISVRRE